MKVKIDIDTRTFVRFILVVISFGVAALAIYSAQTALIIIGTAFFLAIALNPPVSRLAKILPGKSRVGGTALSYVAVILLLGAFVFLVVPPILQQTSRLAESIPSIVDSANDQYKGLNTFIDRYGLREQVDTALDSVKESAGNVARSLGSNLVAGVGNLVSVMTATILILVLAFLMLIEGPIWIKRLWGIYNDQDRMEYHREVLGRMYGVVTGYVVGQLTVSALAGVSAGIVVFILSLIFNVPANFAIPTAAIVALFSLIPLFGATIGAVLVGAILAFNDFTAAIVFVIFFVLYQQFEANYLSPKIQSKRIELSALAILVAVTIGIYLFGIAGGIISIPIAGIVKILAEEYFKRAKRNRIESEKPLKKLLKKLDGSA